MNNNEVIHFVNQFHTRLSQFETEWTKWKSFVDVQTNEWLCLGTVRYASSLLPLDKDVSIGTVKEPFQSIHLQNQVQFETNGSIESAGKTAWTIDTIGCQGFGNLPGFLTSNFTWVGRGSYLLESVELGINWIRVHFPKEWPSEKKQIGIYLHLHDRIEIEGIQRRIQRWITPEMAELDEQFPLDLWEHWTNGNTTQTSVIQTIQVHPIWMTGHLTSETPEMTPFLLISEEGRIFYRSQPTNDIKEDLVWNGSVRIQKELHLENTFTIQKQDMIQNLNAELLNGLSAPKNGELVSTHDEQQLFHKSFGNSINLLGNRITNVGTPIHLHDAVNREFVESWIQGIRPVASVRAVSTQPIIGTWNQEDGYWEKIIDLRQSFDDTELQQGDSVLIRTEKPIYNGIYIILKLNDAYVLKRRQDFTYGLTLEQLCGTYVWCTNGKQWAQTAWVFQRCLNQEIKEIWKQDKLWAIEFELYYQMGYMNCGQGLKQTGGRIELNIQAQQFDISKGILQLLPKSIEPSKFLSSDFIDLDLGPGLKHHGSSRVHLGDICRLSLHWNPSQFITNDQGQLSLLNPYKTYRYDSGRNLEWTEPIRCIQRMEIEDDIVWVKQLSAPKYFHVEFKTQQQQQTEHINQDIISWWVQYWIAGIDSSGKLTTAVSSEIGYQQIIMNSGMRWFVKLSWEGSCLGGYRLWRFRSHNPIEIHTYPEVNEFHEWEEVTVSASTNTCLDILCPSGFQKINWKPYQSGFPNQNQTCEIQAQMGIHGSILPTPLSIGTNTSMATIITMKEINHKQQPAIHLITQAIPNRNAQIVWESEGNTTGIPYQIDWKFSNGSLGRFLCFQKDMIVNLPGEQSTLFIASECWNGSRKLMDSHDRLVVKEGGIYAEGRIATQAPGGFMTEGTGIIGNPAVLQTGMTTGSFHQRPIGNGVSFSWKGGQLDALPMLDGKLAAAPIPIKQFTINHPTDPERFLQHACLEGPSADVYQRGTISISDKTSETKIQFPKYWYYLAKPETITVHLTPSGGPGFCWYERNENDVIVFTEGERIKQVDYWICAQRKHTHFDPEPYRNEISVESWGPYTWTR